MREIALSLPVLLAACDGDLRPPAGQPIAEVEPGEWLPGGDATNTLLLGSNAFLMPAPNLAPDHEAAFYSGNSFFNQSWVTAPASAESRDGLGPLYNAASCSGCHFKDGRGAPPESGLAPLAGLLLRLSVPGDGAPSPDPTYGGQLQDLALPGLAAEASPRITWEEVAVEGVEGLLAPTYHIDAPAYGPMHPDVQISPRVAPHMLGLGLLEAIPASDLASRADPDDTDGDGISGVMPSGRFGWRAEQPTVLDQSAGAFAGDIGVTSALHPSDDCTDTQVDCLAATSGGSPEIAGDLLDKVALYSRAVAVPVRRDWEAEDVLRGKWLFSEIGCDLCHTPHHDTGPFAPLPEFEGQRIWPYTDLLLHDMGSALADDVSSEWRTPPLWGLGLVPTVGGHERFLHDGRARGLEEAVLWHGGEATDSRAAFLDLDTPDRDALIRFLEDL